ncbi:hypothetical protein NDR86_36265, partial [Nocardia sp. CDC141]
MPGVLACGEPVRSPDTSVERAVPECTHGTVVLNSADFLERGRAPDPTVDPLRWFLYRSADSVWCAGLTHQDLIDTGRA